VCGKPWRTGQSRSPKQRTRTEKTVGEIKQPKPITINPAPPGEARRLRNRCRLGRSEQDAARHIARRYRRMLPARAGGSACKSTLRIFRRMSLTPTGSPASHARSGRRSVSSRAAHTGHLPADRRQVGCDHRPAPARLLGVRINKHRYPCTRVRRINDRLRSSGRHEQRPIAAHRVLAVVKVHEL
jgi:hypothetical protein